MDKQLKHRMPKIFQLTSDKIKLPPGPIALTISGDRRQTSYAIGIIQYLIKRINRKNFAVIYGASTGSVIGTMLALSVIKGEDRFADLLSLIQRLNHTFKPLRTIPYILGGLNIAAASSIILKDDALYTADIEALIDEYISNDDWESVVDAGLCKKLELGFSTTCLDDRSHSLITNITAPDIQLLKKALLASIVVPPFTSAIKINGKLQCSSCLTNDPAVLVHHSPLYDLCSSILTINTPCNNNTDSLRSKGCLVSSLIRSAEIVTNSVADKDYKYTKLLNALLAIKESMEPDEWDNIISSISYKLREYIQEMTITKYKPLYQIQPVSKMEFRQTDILSIARIGYEDAKDWFD